MRRSTLILIFIVFLAAPLLAQAPADWQVRIDRSENAVDPDDVPF